MRQVGCLNLFLVVVSSFLIASRLVSGDGAQSSETHIPLFSKLPSNMTATVTPLTTDTTTHCVGLPADMVFILDSSISEGNASFQRQLDFAASIVRHLDIGPSHTQIGAITFSTELDTVQLDLNQYNSKGAVLDALTHIPYQSGASFTGDALRLARTQSLSASQRDNALQVVIVLTDGESSDRNQTEREGASLKGTGALVIAVGIGSDLNPGELELIATDSAHVFSVTSPDFLSTIEDHIVKEISCVNGRWASQACQGTEAADILLFLDASGHCRPHNFDEMVRFLYDLISELPFGPDHMQFTVVSYADRPNGDSWFNSFTDRADLLHLLSTLKIIPGDSSLDVALRFAREYAYAPFHGRRADKPNYAIVVTDCVSESVNDTILQATALKDEQGVDLLSVGLGPRVDQGELRAVASTPSGVFLATDLNHLDHLPGDVARTICQSINALSGTTASPLSMANNMVIG